MSTIEQLYESILMTHRPQSQGEEIANSVSHGVALLAAIGVVPLLIAVARQRNTAGFVGASVFAAAMLVLYLSSTLYHALPAGKSNEGMLNKAFSCSANRKARP